MSRSLDLLHKRFGRLVVFKRMGNTKFGKSRWLCLCDCQKEIVVRGDTLNNENTKSCGCSRIKHGHNTRDKKTATYLSWAGMIQRCTNSNNKKYKDYGGRGITICERWSKFENFLKDMGEQPSKHQIDRINNNGNYNKKNCRWATRKQQARNRRDNHLETYNGKTRCIAAWSEETGITSKTIFKRLDCNWSIKDVLTTPPGEPRKCHI